MNYLHNVANGAANIASAAYNGTAYVAGAAYKGNVMAAKGLTAGVEASHLVASSALEVGNDIRNGITYAVCNPWQCTKNIAYSASGMSNFSEAKSTIWRQPNAYLSKEGDDITIKAKDVRTLLQRVGDSLSQAGIGVAKLGTDVLLGSLYATQAEFRNAVNTTAVTMGSAALQGTKYVVSSAVQVLSSASLEAAEQIRNSPEEALQKAANYTTIISGAVGALGMAYLSAKALLKVEEERAKGSKGAALIKEGEAQIQKGKELMDKGAKQIQVGDNKSIQSGTSQIDEGTNIVYEGSKKVEQGKALVNSAGWGSRFKMAAYFASSAVTAVAAATLAAVSYQAYTK